MKILIIGSGGREHALGNAIFMRRNVTPYELHFAPGNAGMTNIGTCHNVRSDDIAGLVKLAKELKIGLVIVGPELPLVLGIKDELELVNIPCFGPSKAASQLEGSKIFMKNLCARYGVPTARYETFDNEKEALLALRKFNLPVVIKTDGLAAGKGVIIANSQIEAERAIKDMFQGKFGDAGNKLIIEEFLEGEEVSFFAITSNGITLPFNSAQDHKRVGDGDTGPNTGGMGAYSPAPIFTKEMQEIAMKTIIDPVVSGMIKDGIPYSGVLFAGLMIVKNKPYLLEFNIRLGDPEAEAIMPLLKTDFVEIALKTANGTLDSLKTIEFSNQSSIAVVIASKGYPESYENNHLLPELPKLMDDISIFHSGTKLNSEGKLVSNGGRVLTIAATGNNLKQARDAVYAVVKRIGWAKGHYRKDIGYKAINLLEN